jgi:uncharacterized OB-fold protein
MTGLSATYVLEYAYRRSTGPVIGRFLTGLRDGRIEGIRTADGRTIVPPVEYDPQTGESTTDWVEVAQVGTVETWSWVHEPRRLHPLDRPFAWALIRLDGSDTGLLHVVDAMDSSAMSSGMRVRVRWAEERVGSMTDIACFEPVS